jgi:AP-1 complex subunit gamma-1
MGLFGNTSLSSSSPAAAPSYAAPTASADLFSALGNGSSPAAPKAAAPAPAVTAPSGPQPIEAYHQNGLRVTLTAQRDSNNRSVCNILAKFTATEGSPVSSVNFQAAVPKTQKLQMLAMSNTDVQPGKTETQQLRVMVSAPGVSCRRRK